MSGEAVGIEALRQAFEQAEIAEVLPPIHPGEILREEFMAPLGLTAGAIARALHLPRSRIERIVKEEVGISTDTALRLSRFFGNSHQFWLNLQNQFESEVLMSEIGKDLEKIEPAVWPDVA